MCVYFVFLFFYFSFCLLSFCLFIFVFVNCNRTNDIQCSCYFIAEHCSQSFRILCMCLLTESIRDWLRINAKKKICITTFRSFLFLLFSIFVWLPFIFFLLFGFGDDFVCTKNPFYSENKRIFFFCCFFLVSMSSTIFKRQYRF